MQVAAALLLTDCKMKTRGLLLHMYERPSCTKAGGQGQALHRSKGTLSLGVYPAGRAWARRPPCGFNERECCRHVAEATTSLNALSSAFIQGKAEATASALASSRRSCRRLQTWACQWAPEQVCRWDQHCICSPNPPSRTPKRANVATRNGAFPYAKIQYDSAEWKQAFLSQAREFLFFPLLPREASKWVSIFDRGTGSQPERLRSGSLQAYLSLIV